MGPWVRKPYLQKHRHTEEIWGSMFGSRNRELPKDFRARQTAWGSPGEGAELVSSANPEQKNKLHAGVLSGARTGVLPKLHSGSTISQLSPIGQLSLSMLYFCYLNMRTRVAHLSLWIGMRQKTWVLSKVPRTAPGTWYTLSKMTTIGFIIRRTLQKSYFFFQTNVSQNHPLVLPSSSGTGLDGR